MALQSKKPYNIYYLYHLKKIFLEKYGYRANFQKQRGLGK